MNRTRTTLFLLLLILGLPAAPALRSQEQEPPEQENPAPVEEIDKAALKELVRNPALADPQLLVQVYKGSLRHWPYHKKGEEAVEQILKGGKATIPFLLPLLDERDYRLKPAVAYLLGRFGCREARDKVEALLYVPQLKGSAFHILQALRAIDAPYAEKLSVGLLAAENPSLRQAAFSLLDGMASIADSIPELKALLQSSVGDVRHKAFCLLAKEPGDAIDQAALLLVGDEYPKLAQEVFNYLATRFNPTVVEGLKGMLTFEPERPFAFALVTLVELEKRFNEVLLDASMEKSLHGFLNSRDPLFRVSAAAALSGICFRRSSEEDLNLIRNAIVPCFMDVFLKNRYFKDFACMLDVAAGSLQQVTGAPFDKDITFWHAWWKEEGQTQVDDLILIAVAPEEIPRVRIACRGLCREKNRSFLIVGEDAMDGAAERTIRLSTQDMGRLIDFLYTDGFFERLSRPGHEGADREPAIEMTLENRRRRVVPESVDDRGFASMEKRVVDLYENNQWQLLYTQGDRKKWWENRYAWWKEQAGEEDGRTRRFLEDLLDSFDRLPDDVLLESYDWLRTRRDLAACLDFNMGVGFLSRVSKARWEIDGVVQGLVDLLAATKNTEHLEPLITYLYGAYDQKAFPLLGRAIFDLGQLEPSLHDSRWYVRAMAAGAAGRAGPKIVARLEPMLNDTRPEVRSAAIRSLTKLEGGESLAMLNRVMAGDDETEKQVLLASLDSVSAPLALPLLEQGLQAAEAQTRRIALNGLSAIQSSRSAGIIKAFIERPGLSPDEAEAGMEALRAMGGDAARAELLDLLSRTGPGETYRKLILLLADLGETSVFPHLIDLMLDQAYRDRALDAMAYLMVADFGGEVWRYREVWEKYHGERQSFFLREALGIGHAAPPGGKSYEGISVDDLVGALRHPAWPVRLAALRILEEGSHESFGGLTKDSPQEEIEGVAEAWERWLGHESSD